MNKHPHVFSATFLIMLATLSFVVPTGTSYSQDKQKLSAGAARVNITPKEKIPIGWHSGENTPYDKEAIRVGNIVFAGISGEVFHEIGMNLKKQSPYTHTFILTHCNGSSGYLPTDKAYDELSYEVAASVIMSGAEQAIMTNLIEMIDEL